MIRIKVFKGNGLYVHTSAETLFNDWAKNNPNYWVKSVTYKLEDFKTQRETLLVTYTEERPTNNYDIEAMIG